MNGLPAMRVFGKLGLMQQKANQILIIKERQIYCRSLLIFKLKNHGIKRNKIIMSKCLESLREKPG